MLLIVLAASSGAAADASGSKSSSAATLIRRGSDALDHGDLQTAKSLFNQVLRLEPHNVQAHTFLGVIADRAGSLAEAQHNFQAAVAAAPSSPEARNNYGAILLRLGQAQEAAHQFERSLVLNPKQPAALVNLASIRFSSGNSEEDFSSARKLLLQAISLQPDSDAERALIMVDCRLHDRKLALADYERYRASSSTAKSLEEPSKRRDLGAALLHAGIYPQAIDELNAARMDPTDSETVVLLAKAQRATGEQVAAGRTLESALAGGLRSGAIYAELAKVYEATGHLENAIPAMRLAIEQEPNNVDYRFHYGILLTNSKAPQGAVNRLEESIAKFPKSPKLWFALGFAQLEDYNDSAARSSFMRSAELDPNYAPAQAFLGVTALDQAQYKEAERYYSRALQLAPHVGILHQMISEAMQKEQPPDISGAESELKRCIQMEPSFAAAHLALGKLYMRENNFVLAMASLQEAVRLDPGLTEAHFHLGRAYHRLKRDDAAQAELEKFKHLSQQEKDQQIKDREDVVRKLANVFY